MWFGPTTRGYTADTTTQLVHGQSFTVTGSGFGTSSTTFLVRDTQTDPVGTVSAQWNAGAAPGGHGTQYDFQLQNVGFQPSSFSIGAPHPYVSKILAGCHLDLTNPYNEVAAAVTFTAPTLPFCVRGSWYYRFDPGWVFDPQSDNNLKDLNWNIGTVTFPVSGNFFYTNWPTVPNNFYAISGITNASQTVVTINTAQAGNPFLNATVWEFNSVSGMTQINGLYASVLSTGGSFGAWTATFNLDTTGFSAYTSGGFANRPFNNSQVTAQCGTDAFQQNGMFEGPNDANGHNTSFWNQMLYPMNASTGWIKRSWEMCVTTTAGLPGGGYFNVWDNNNISAPVMNYAGHTEVSSAVTTRCVGMGDYARDRSATNFRYYADVLIAYSGTGASQVALVCVGNNPVYANCTIVEDQVNDTWTGGSIHIPAFWKGKLQGGTTGYIFVRTEGGGVISAGSATIAVSP